MPLASSWSSCVQFPSFFRETWWNMKHPKCYIFCISSLCLILHPRFGYQQLHNRCAACRTRNPESPSMILPKRSVSVSRSIFPTAGGKNDSKGLFVTRLKVRAENTFCCFFAGLTSVMVLYTYSLGIQRQPCPLTKMRRGYARTRVEKTQPLSVCFAGIFQLQMQKDNTSDDTKWDVKRMARTSSHTLRSWLHPVMCLASEIL